jgi:hypothetical protein
VSEPREELVDELVGLAGNLQMTYLAASIAVRSMFDSVAQRSFPKLKPGDPAPTMYFSKDDPNDPTRTLYGGWLVADAVANAREGGPIDTGLGSQLVIVLYANWEGEFRPRLARLVGCDPEDVKVPYFGDLRRFRNDILHNQGVAEKSAHCEIFKWFAAGDTVQIVGERVHDLIARLPKDDLLCQTWQ